MTRSTLALLIVLTLCSNADADPFGAGDGSATDLTGDWLSSSGSAFSVLDTGREVSVWLKSSPTIDEFVGLLYRDGNRLYSVYWLAKFNHDPLTYNLRFKAEVADSNHVSVQFEIVRWKQVNLISSTLLRKSGYGTWTKISGSGLSAEGIDGERDFSSNRLLSEKSQLESDISQLELGLIDARGEHARALAQGWRFANLRPAERVLPNFSDLYNGTIIDYRYHMEPVVELSPASPRYGDIVGRYYRAHSLARDYASLLGRKKRELARVTYVLDKANGSLK